MTPSSDTARKNRLDCRDALFFLLLAAAAAFFFWRVRYGFANIDESFYPTIARRLTQGDRLFLDEWHVSQLSSVLLYLPVWLYERLNGGTDGIYLALRYLFVAVQSLVSAAVYLRLRRSHRAGAAAGALALAMYAPFGINALSYNSLGVLLLSLTGALLVPAGERSRAAYLLAGLCFAGTVLCCPYLALVYVLYTLAVVLLRKRPARLPAFSLHAFALFTLGAAILAAAFFLLGLRGADLSRLPAALQGIFSDPEHAGRTSFLRLLLRLALRYPYHVLYHAHPLPGTCLLLMLALSLAALLDKRREQHAAAYFLAGTALTAAAEILYAVLWPHPNFMMYAVNVLALLCFVLTPPSDADAARRLALLWWLPGMLYSALIILGSNQGHFAIFSAAASAVPCSVTVAFRTAKHVFPERKPLRAAAAAALAVLVLAQAGGTAYLRYRNVFWGATIHEQTETITEGTHKGLIVEPESAKLYASTQPAMAELARRSGGGRVLVLTEYTWMSMGDYQNAAYSPWLSGVNDTTLDRLEMYYALCPENRPAAAWAAAEDAACAEAFCARFGYAAETTPDGIFMTPVQ